MAVAVRTTSLVASAGMLGAAVIAALTMSIALLPPAPVLIDGDPILVVPDLQPPPTPPIVTRTTPPRTAEPTEQAPVETPPSTVQTTSTTYPVADPGPAIEVITRPHWLHRPANLQIYYPRRALQNEIDGDVVLDCLVTIAGALRCAVVSETPVQWGFGAAALRIAADHRMEPAIRGGLAVEGRYRMRVPFRVE